MTIHPLFTADFERELRQGKYTQWVLLREFSEDHLLCLLCMIGEFDACASKVLRPIWRDWAMLRGQYRSVLALEALHRIVRGERFDRQEWARRIPDGRMYREVGDLPEIVRNALSVNVPGAEWNLVMMIAEGYELGGKDADGKNVYAYFSEAGGVIHIGPARRRGETTNPSIFSARLSEAIGRDSRARWATMRVIAQEDLLCLLWLAGEFEAMSHGVFGHLDSLRAELQDVNRALIALRAMHCMVRFRERFDIDELDRRFDRGRAHLEFDDLPDAVRDGLERASPGTCWTFVWMLQGKYVLVGNDTAGQSIEVSVSPLGEVVPNNQLNDQFAGSRIKGIAN